MCPVPGPPTLFVVVDTEEEFDWSAPFSRASTGVHGDCGSSRAFSGCSIGSGSGRPTSSTIRWPPSRSVIAALRARVESGRCDDRRASASVGHAAVHARRSRGANSFACNLGDGAGRGEAAHAGDGDRGERRRSGRGSTRPAATGSAAPRCASCSALDFDSRHQRQPADGLPRRAAARTSRRSTRGRSSSAANAALLEVPCTLRVRRVRRGGSALPLHRARRAGRAAAAAGGRHPEPQPARSTRSCCRRRRARSTR